MIILKTIISKGKNIYISTYFIVGNKYNMNDLILYFKVVNITYNRQQEIK